LTTTKAASLFGVEETLSAVAVDVSNKAIANMHQKEEERISAKAIVKQSQAKELKIWRIRSSARRASCIGRQGRQPMQATARLAPIRSRFASPQKWGIDCQKIHDLIRLLWWFCI
jgi:hypothetical protein